MTQRIDWESLGKAAGEAEKNTAPGLASTRPRDWKPNSGQLARSHESTRRFNANRELDKKLDAVLGPVKAPRVTDAVRFCKCGCGVPVSVRARYTAECRKRVRRDRHKAAHKTVTGTPQKERPKRMAGVPMRAPIKRCEQCADLSERRPEDGSACSGCGLVWVPERIR
jgi:hypothetical protein